MVVVERMPWLKNGPMLKMAEDDADVKKDCLSLVHIVECSAKLNANTAGSWQYHLLLQ